jgi:acyl-CoA thioesterase FadM
MPRIQVIELPNYEFHYKIIVQARDVNYRGHLGIDALIALLSEAGYHMFRSLGFGGVDLGDEQVGFITADMALSFKSEASMFDDLDIESHLADFEKKGFRVYHRVTNKRNTIALAEVDIVVFNYKERRAADVPKTLMSALEKYKDRLSIQ